MILTDDNFATIVTAVEGGRGLYDNLMKYIRFQMVVLLGFIFTFVGAAIFNIAHGTPLLPLQILWINFAIDVPLAVGLGFDAPTAGLMNRKPRSPDEPVLARPLAARLAIGGLMIAIGTLIVVSYGETRYGLAVATTMGLTASSLMHIVATFEWRDGSRTIFNNDTLANGRFVLISVVVVGLTILATSLGALQRILDTTDLSGDQWRVILSPSPPISRSPSLESSSSDACIETPAEGQQDAEEGVPGRSCAACAQVGAMREYVKSRGRRCGIVFEGRDTAGKGGTIKAITDKVSPRVFRIVALPAPTDREKSQMYMQRYVPHFPRPARSRHLRPQLVQPRRRRAGDGIPLRARPSSSCKPPLFEEGDGRLGHHPGEVLARGRVRGTKQAVAGPHRRPPQDLETLRHGHEVVHALG